MVRFRPQQGLTIMNATKNNFINALTDRIGFPSPTGVNYYESYQQFLNELEELKKFPSPTGLTIMNTYL